MANLKKQWICEHYYNPVQLNLRDADHLFGIPRLCGYEWNHISSGFAIDCSKRGARQRALFKYTISGAGELTVNGKTSRIEAGTAFLLAGQLNENSCSYRIAPGADHWEFLFLSFDKPGAISIAKSILRENGGNIFHPEHALGDAWHLFEIFKTGEIQDKYAVSSLGYDFFMHLAGDAATGGNDLLHRVEAYCFQHLGEQVTVEDLANYCGYSRWHFAKAFHHIAGMPPSKFIMEQKLTSALHILQHEALTVKEIAGRCGFDDPGHFGRRFKQRFGVTPANFEQITGHERIKH